MLSKRQSSPLPSSAAYQPTPSPATSAWYVGSLLVEHGSREQEIKKVSLPWQNSTIGHCGISAFRSGR